jgi:hypothetical protein
MTTSNVNNKRPSYFRDAVVAVENDSKPSNMRFGENGCPEFTDTGSDLLSLSQLVRGSDPSSLCDQILLSSSVRDVTDLIILTFVTRNIRGGKGEKDLSYAMFLRIWRHYPETAKKMLRLFASHYGYWKDLLLIAEKSKTMWSTTQEYEDKENVQLTDFVLKESIDIMRTQFQSDLDAMTKYEARKEDKDNVYDDYDTKMKCEKIVDADTVPGLDAGPNISLIAKWLPRENSHFDKKLGFLKLFLQQDDIKQTAEVKSWESRLQKTYRKQVAKLTSYLSLPEVFLSAQRSDEINFHRMASRATLKLSRALLNETKSGSVRRPNDRKRQRCADLFVDHLSREGLKGGALMPDEIVAEILRGKVSPMREKVLDAQWKDLWKNVVEQVEAKAKGEGLGFNPSKMVPLSDVSGSMHGKPMEVAIAMGIGISEITHPAFRDMVLTFESKPQWHMLNSADTIVRKVKSLEIAGWGMSTNFEAAYDKIMEVCVKQRLAKEDVPSLIVFSDMQFDQAHENIHYCGRRQIDAMVSMHNVIRSKFAAAGRKLDWEDSDPTPIVYWNLRDTGGHPVEKDTEGAVLLSGYSPSILKLVMNGEALEDKEVEIVEADGNTRKEKIRVTPSEVLRKMLNDPLYDSVRDILAMSNEGVLEDFNPIDLSHIPGAMMTNIADEEFELV